jgi:hypothetical protein
VLAPQAHDYFKGIDFDALLRREIAMKPEWIPVIKGDHDVSLFDPKVHKMVCSPPSKSQLHFSILFLSGCVG